VGEGLRAVTEQEIVRDWKQFTGGPPVVGALDAYEPSGVEGLVWEDGASGRRAVVTWWTEAQVAEIVSVHAEPAGGGAGTRIMDAAEAELQRRGVRRLVVATTNDNVRALNFYQKRGYRLVRLHLDAMDRVRTVKPGLPQTGRDGIPLRDMWELEKEL